jgi:hypothetical protein
MAARLSAQRTGLQQHTYTFAGSIGAQTVTLRATEKALVGTSEETYTQTATVPVNEPYTFRFEEIEMPSRDPSSDRVPAWFPVAGYVSGAATLTFFMYVALGGVAKPTFAHHAVLSFGLALSLAFIGGKAAAQGYGENPVGFSVGGGFAVFVISLLLLSYIWK